MVADWWKRSPQEVEQWTMVDFSNREEYMMIQIYLSLPPEKRKAKPKREPWGGPKRNG
jgi:hypothetical protein